jgi:hypothetical protein
MSSFRLDRVGCGLTLKWPISYGRPPAGSTPPLPLLRVAAALPHTGGKNQLHQSLWKGT